MKLRDEFGLTAGRGTTANDRRLRHSESDGYFGFHR